MPRLPRAARRQLKNMPDYAKSIYKAEYKNTKKSQLVASVMWLIGWHYAYLDQWGVQLVFWLTGGGLLLWWLADFFRVGHMVNRYNKLMAAESFVDAASTVPEELPPIIVALKQVDGVTVVDHSDRFS